MNILVTGSKGQLGSEIRERSLGFLNWNFFFCDSKKLDVIDATAIKDFVEVNKISAIINCAAYTAVDKAELDKENAFSVNVTGAKNLAYVAAKKDLFYIHTSTDFVFDGTKNTPYKEEDIANPQNVYGATKLKSEQEVLNLHPSSVVIRTSWLYSQYGGNFVKTIQRLGLEKESIGVIFDQLGTPTWAGDLATSILEILEQLEQGNTHKGIYHYSNEGVASWYDFAVEIMELSIIKCKVLPIEAVAYPTPAKRPSFSVMNKAKIKADFGVKIPHWKKSLQHYIKESE